ncbi:type II toxin-antitoxin system VapC family toxin [Sphingobium terrigena]|uniref:Type II toxin-antitoxin system VapC family toxin n=1 Tax=Sphingobium terrigena TaxID=2304063 RepID=A0A418YUW6_9SPHN|nr:type II toxin-antitoxin system VapC family toxin [Sphingobium terrigena]RJG55919.1 type II toxin-antitoxin system VapC family toxin [Sphingobium terrigena]
MKLLIDTHILIWWLEDSPRLGQKARFRLSNPQNVVLASVVSLWEITIKWRVGKMHLPGSAFADVLREQNVDLLAVTSAHVAAVEMLDFHHGDPFDHLILAQAQAEGATLMTNDRQMTAYGVPCIGIS